MDCGMGGTGQHGAREATAVLAEQMPGAAPQGQPISDAVTPAPV